MEHIFFVFLHLGHLLQYYVFPADHPPRLFVRPVRSGYRDISWTARAISMKLTGNIHRPLLMTWLEFGGQMSSVKVTEGCHGGEA